MPFDGTTFPLIAVPTVAPFCFETATPDERLLELARWLEDEQAWRDSKMEWNFSTSEAHSSICGAAGCAVGLAMILWGPSFRNGDFWEGTTAFDISDKQWWNLFGRGLAEHLGFYGADENDESVYGLVTPGMVAAAIREFVAKRSAS